MTDPEVTAVEAMAETKLLALFERCELPRRMWNHRAHVTVAYLYLRQYPLPVAIAKMRAGIQAYNAVAGQGVGYHETVTRTWLHLIHTTMHNHGASDSARNFFNRHTYLLDKTLPLLFYSDQRIMSGTARAGFIEPDLMPLPDPTPKQPDPAGPGREPLDVPIPRDPYEAIKRTSRILESEPNNNQALCDRGQMHLRRGELEPALADFQRAISLAPSEGDGYFWLATVQATRNEADAAIANLKQALAKGYRWFGSVYKHEGWRKLRQRPDVEALLQQYAAKYQMRL
jgi:tetratricopeptide (TPR) repeat protein